MENRLHVLSKWIFTISQGFFGNLGVYLIHPPSYVQAYPPALLRCSRASCSAELRAQPSFLVVRGFAFLQRRPVPRNLLCVFACCDLGRGVHPARGDGHIPAPWIKVV